MSHTATSPTTSAAATAATLATATTAAPFHHAPVASHATAIGILIAERMAHRPPSPIDAIARQQAIENALSTALHLVRTSDKPEALQRATGRAIRAASMLKQACTESRAAP